MHFNNKNHKRRMIMMMSFKTTTWANCLVSIWGTRNENACQPSYMWCETMEWIRDLP
jgi:hypothetical protein